MLGWWWGALSLLGPELPLAWAVSPRGHVWRYCTQCWVPGAAEGFCWASCCPPGPWVQGLLPNPLTPSPRSD